MATFIKSDNNIYLIDSNSVQVFPCAYRGSNIDKYAQLNTEYNITHLPGTSFARSYVTESGTNHLYFVLDGYYFELDGLKFDGKQIKMTDGTLVSYVFIKTALIAEDKKSTVLSDVTKSSNTADVSDRTLDNADGYFYGLGFGNAIPAEAIGLDITTTGTLITDEQVGMTGSDLTLSQLFNCEGSAATLTDKVTANGLGGTFTGNFNGNLSGNVTANSLKVAGHTLTLKDGVTLPADKELPIHPGAANKVLTTTGNGLTWTDTTSNVAGGGKNCVVMTDASGNITGATSIADAANVSSTIKGKSISELFIMENEQPAYAKLPETGSITVPVYIDRDGRAQPCTLSTLPTYTLRTQTGNNPGIKLTKSDGSTSGTAEVTGSNGISVSATSSALNISGIGLESRIDTVEKDLQEMNISSSRTDNVSYRIMATTVSYGLPDITATAATYIQNNKVYATGFVATSDRRLKENIEDYHCSKSILDLPVKKFDFIDGPKNQIGCIAQDLKDICPEIVEEDENGYLHIAEDKLVYLLLQEVKELKAEVAELKRGK